jgi:hypothetical protein
MARHDASSDAEFVVVLREGLADYALPERLLPRGSIAEGWVLNAVNRYYEFSRECDEFLLVYATIPDLSLTRDDPMPQHLTISKPIPGVIIEYPR